jgi:Helix-turn-helix domain
MSEQSKMIVTITGLDEIVEAAVERALAKRKPAKLLFTLEEASTMLNCERSWLANKVRAGEVPHRRSGHRIYFARPDIDEIIERSAVNGKNGKG